MNNKYTKPLILVVVFLVLSLITTASYAYFSATVNGNTNAYNTVITSGTMQLLLTDEDKVALDNAIPGSSVTKTFKVKNTGTVATTYDIYLSELLNTFEDKNDLVYVLTSPTGCQTTSEAIVPSVVGEQSKIVSSCSINPNVEHEYTLTITFKEDNTNQDDNKGKNFSAKININEYKERDNSIATQIKELKEAGATDLEYDGISTLGEYGTEDNNLRYVGATPNNYIYFNCSTTNSSEMNDTTCEKWRIIGIMNNIEDENGNIASRVKIMRDESLGNYSWDTSESTVNNGWGINQWGASGTYEGADLMRELNTDYLGNITVGTDSKWYDRNNNSKTANMPTSALNQNAQNMIQEVKWHTGSNSQEASDLAHNGDYSILKTKNMYEHERSNNTSKICSSEEEEYGKLCNDEVTRTTTWTGKVALMYPSDYSYSTSGGATLNKNACLNIPTIDWYDQSNINGISDCYQNTWIYNENYWQWTLSPRADSSAAGSVFLVYDVGSVALNYARYGYAVRPAVFLQSSISITGGNGSSSNPYKLTM